jgi:hypothetical protein
MMCFQFNHLSTSCLEKPMEKLIKETLEIMKGNKGKSKQLENQQENQVTEEYT